MSEINIESNEESDSTSVKCKAIITEIMPTMPSIYNESKFDPNITCVFAAIQVNYNAVTKNDIVSNVSDCSVATKNDIVSNVNDCSAAIKKNIVCSINNYLTKLGEGQYPVDDKPHGLRDFFSNHAEMNTLADVINEYCPFLKGTILYYDANSELNAKDLAFAIGCNIMIFVAVNVNINYQTLTSPSSSSSSSSSSSPFSSPSSSSSSSSQYKPNKWMSLDGNMKKNNRAVKELLGANPITSRNENGNVTLEIPERIIEIMQNGNAAVIVDNKGNIISEGRDGFAYGLTEEELNKGGFDLCPGDRELLWVSAIKNAILFYLQKNRIITENTLLFVTHKPCFNCGKTINGAGIKKVFYLKDDTNGSYVRNNSIKDENLQKYIETKAGVKYEKVESVELDNELNRLNGLNRLNKLNELKENLEGGANEIADVNSKNQTDIGIITKP